MNMSGKTKKATFNLPPDILAELDKAMADGAAPSKNALVGRALVKELDELRRRARKLRWEEGARLRNSSSSLTNARSTRAFLLGAAPSAMALSSSARTSGGKLKVAFFVFPLIFI